MIYICFVQNRNVQAVVGFLSGRMCLYVVLSGLFSVGGGIENCISIVNLCGRSGAGIKDMVIFVKPL